MKIPKPSSGAVKLFEELTPREASVSTRLVFGQPAAFTNGNMFFGVFGEKVFVRLSEADRTEALRKPGFTTFEPMPGRAMSEYMVLPRSLVRDPGRAKEWVARSLNYAVSLPVKQPKGKTK